MVSAEIIIERSHVILILVYTNTDLVQYSEKV